MVNENDEYQNGGVSIRARAPTKFAMAVLAVVSGLGGLSGGRWLAIDAESATQADVYKAEYAARIAERRNAEWETCWRAFRLLEPLDDARCPPAYVEISPGGIK